MNDLRDASDERDVTSGGSSPSCDLIEPTTERALRELSRWSGPAIEPGSLARTALTMNESLARPPFLMRVFPSRRSIVGIAALLMFSAIAVVASVRWNNIVMRSVTDSARAHFDLHDGDVLGSTPPAALRSIESNAGGGYDVGGSVTTTPQDGIDPHSSPSMVSGAWSITPPNAPAVRSVIRRTSIGLTVKDLAHSFAEAQRVVRTTDGEFVESSQLHIEGQQAALTLRVSSSRLNEALHALRALGEVNAESANGTDITDQLIDLDARIRNERRVEAELLELLSERDRAPLDEIMRVRAQLDGVRQSIERLDAQAARAARQVAFAEINVTLRLPEKANEPLSSVVPTPLSYSATTIAQAWQTALRAATDGVAFLLTLLVGGLPWWCLLSVVGVLLRAWWNRRVASGLV